MFYKEFRTAIALLILRLKMKYRDKHLRKAYQAKVKCLNPKPTKQLGLNIGTGSSQL